MKKLICITGFVFIAFVFFASAEVSENVPKDNNCSKKWEKASDAELMKSIKADAARMGEKLKILSARYYVKAKEAAKDGKKEAYDAYDSCAASLKEMGDGFDENKAELVEKGKVAYKKAIKKLVKVKDKVADKLSNHVND